MKQESNRQTKMEDIDGGLHPALDGQSLDEDEDRTRAGKIPMAQAGTKPQICRSQGGRLNHYANEADSQLVQYTLVQRFILIHKKTRHCRVHECCY